MATQFVKFFGLFIPVVILWIVLFFQWIPGVRLSPALMNAWTTLPLYALFLLGFYAVSSVGFGVATFNDCPDAADGLKLDIEEAKRELRKKGFQF